MQQPSHLKKGDTITIISTARKISMTELISAIKLIESWDLEVKLGKNLFAEHNQFAGTKQHRLEDLQTALNDQESKAIFCARGGYGTIQLIDEVDFSLFIKNPKWIVGYSDVTVLHNHINQNFKIETLHATMPVNFVDGQENEATLSLKKALFGELLKYEFHIEDGSIHKSESITAPIIGGNLSILYSLTGTCSQINTKGKLLFIEDLDEYLYHIDRMVMNLKRAKIFEGCLGVLVGGMTDMNDNQVPYGQTAKEIIFENCKNLNIPILFGFPAGHIKENLTIIMNRNASLSIQENKAIINFNGRA